MRTFADFNWQAAPATSSFFIKPDELSRGALLQYLGLRQKSLGIVVRGIEPKRLLKLCYGFRVATPFRKRHAEIQVARSKLRPQPDNFLKLSEGIGWSIPCRVSQPKVEVSFGKTGVSANSFFELF